MRVGEDPRLADGRQARPVDERDVRSTPLEARTRAAAPPPRRSPTSPGERDAAAEARRATRRRCPAPPGVLRLAHEVDDRHGRLRRDPSDVPVDVPVEHHVADDQDGVLEHSDRASLLDEPPQARRGRLVRRGRRGGFASGTARSDVECVSDRTCVQDCRTAIKSDGGRARARLDFSARLRRGPRRHASREAGRRGRRAASGPGWPGRGA